LAMVSGSEEENTPTASTSLWSAAGCTRFLHRFVRLPSWPASTTRFGADRLTRRSAHLRFFTATPAFPLSRPRPLAASATSRHRHAAPAAAGQCEYAQAHRMLSAT